MGECALFMRRRQVLDEHMLYADTCKSHHNIRPQSKIAHQNMYTDRIL